MAVSAVAGMGGVGKTELAIRYARQHEADYPGGICWLNARDSNLAAEIVQFAQLYMNLKVPQKLGESPLNLKEQVEWCWQNWYTPPAPLSKARVRRGEGLVLVVLDDVTDLGSCREVLPTASRFRVLMTTRLRGLDTNFVEIRLDVLSPEAALELLTALVGERRVGLTSPPAPLLRGEGSKSNSLSPPFPRREGGLGGLGFSDAFGTSPPAPLLRREGSKSPSPSVSPPFPRREGGQGGLGSSDALQLCEWLGYLPLGLELVGRYLADDPDLSLAEMLERLKAQRLQDEAIDLDEQQLHNTCSTAQRGVRAAFELSWQELPPITQRVGQLLSLFSPTVIPWEIVTVSRQISLLNWTEADINLAKKQLRKLHFVQEIEERDSCYKFHPLIRFFLQSKLENSKQADTFRKIFLECIDQFKQNQASEILEQNLDIIAERTAEQFQEFEFGEEPRHPKEIDRLDFLEEITVTVESVTVIKQSLLYVSDDFLECELILEIVFTPEGSYPDQEMSYYDSEEGEWCTLNTITEVGVQNTQILTVKVLISFDENDPLDINEVDDVEFVDGISLVKMRK